MSENTTETIIGGIVIVVAAAFLYYMLQSTEISHPRGSIELSANFRSAEGVSVGTDVRLAGVKIGTVTGLDLNPKTYFAEAHFTVPADIELATDTQALITSEGLLGGSFIEIVPGGAAENLGNGDEIEQTQGAISVVSLLLKFVGGGEKK
ncbi:MAG: outer membrane lipid asymmetry maintenance protein MlaD [Rhodobacteraceae bacterium]|nr:outer membrane lipid asymmetry maintenance protein MlaD [Paracoccaceae bacterium]